MRNGKWEVEVGSGTWDVGVRSKMNDGRCEMGSRSGRKGSLVAAQYKLCGQFFR